MACCTNLASVILGPKGRNTSSRRQTVSLASFRNLPAVPKGTRSSSRRRQSSQRRSLLPTRRTSDGPPNGLPDGARRLLSPVPAPRRTTFCSTGVRPVASAARRPAPRSARRHVCERRLPTIHNDAAPKHTKRRRQERRFRPESRPNAPPSASAARYDAAALCQMTGDKVREPRHSHAEAERAQALEYARIEAHPWGA